LAEEVSYPKPAAPAYPKPAAPAYSKPSYETYVIIYIAFFFVQNQNIYLMEYILQAPRPYSFGYDVKDNYYNDYAHQESSDGKVTTGSYRVLLPDGRTQIVTYKADDYGYVADVKYEGTAKYPEYTKPTSYSAPAAYPKPAAPAAYPKPAAPAAYPKPAAPAPPAAYPKAAEPAAEEY